MFKLTLIVFLGLALRETCGEWVWNNVQNDGYCAKGTETTNPSKCCAFPFDYYGKTYTTCTTDWENGLWCSTTATYAGEWEWCADTAAACVPECKNGGTCNSDGTCTCTADRGGVDCGKCAAGQATMTADVCCKFPFTYYGKTYQSCTADYENGLWCSTDTTYDGNWQWCAESVPVCDPACQNGGQCLDGSCECVGGYTGNDCATPPAPARCNANSYKCYGQTGHTGDVLFETTVADIGACRKACCDHGECIGFDFNRRDNSCILSAVKVTDPKGRKGSVLCELK